jgi:hypothetical protein
MFVGLTVVLFVILNTAVISWQRDDYCLAIGLSYLYSFTTELKKEIEVFFSNEGFKIGSSVGT